MPARPRCGVVRRTSSTSPAARRRRARRRRPSSGPQPGEHRPYDTTGAPGRFEPAFLLDPRADQLEVEAVGVAAGQRLGDEPFDRDGAVAWNGAPRQRAVAEHVVAELDQPGARERAPYEPVDIAFGPAVEHV